MTPLVILVDIVVDNIASEATQYAFLKSPVRIGRSELNDLPLEMPFVSSWHAVVRFDERDVQFVDLGSTNGSVLDGARLEKNAPALVGPESEVRIGSLRLRFARRASAARSAAPQRRMTQFAERISPPVVAAAAEPAEPRPEPAVPEPAQVEAVERALAAAAEHLDLLYTSFRGSCEHLRSAMGQVLEGMDAPTRTLALARLDEKYGPVAPDLFRSLGGEEPQAAAGAAPAGGLGGRATRFLAAFAQSYLPAPEAAATDEGAELLLGRTAEVLESFARSYLELRRGYVEFGREMGLRTIRAEGPVEQARDSRQLLSWLLDLRAESRAADLQSAFADLMVHQVALVNGATEVARGILARLSPESVALESGQAVWPVKAVAHWKAFEARWHEMADEEDSISEALFGPEFARAYTAIMGGHRAHEERRRSGNNGEIPSWPMPAR